MLRFITQIALPQMRIVGCDVGRICRDDIELHAGQRMKPVAVKKIYMYMMMRGVAACDGKRRQADVARAHHGFGCSCVSVLVFAPEPVRMSCLCPVWGLR